MIMREGIGRRRPRRWLLYLAAGLALCTGAPAAAGVGWTTARTYEADQGQPSPDSAANVFMLAVSTGEEIGLRSALAPQRRDELLNEWRGIRRDITRTDPQPSKVSTGVFVVEHQDDDRAQVVTDVQAVRWGEGFSGSITGTPRPWRFEVHRDGGGWRVWAVDPHPWCGGHVRASACQQP
ncbi:hypothetical protein ACFY2R_10495 [Micromonospora olivasterospora]|nr:hypothetical protein [Micromonospora olivasterospora]